MDLERFFPYRVSHLAEAVSLATAQVYSERFHLSRDEWRIVSALGGESGAVKTAQVLESSSLDKMRVSRALARLEQGGLIERSPDPDDGRGQLLRLLPAGRAMYRKIVPMVQAREEFLLAALDPQERKAFDKALAALRERAEQLIRQG